MGTAGKHGVLVDRAFVGHLACIARIAWRAPCSSRSRSRSLVPLDQRRFDVRLKGPNVTPGYWRQQTETAQAFDEEGFYRLGDALCFVDPAVPMKGFAFEGRIAEDFKLSTGTWVHVGELRRDVIAHFAPLLRDAVIAGHDRDEVTVLLVPDVEACRRLCGNATAADHRLLRSASLRRVLQERLDDLGKRATGSNAWPIRRTPSRVSA